MAPRFLTILTGRNLPKIRQSREAEPSTVLVFFRGLIETRGIANPA
jgi:hypothetical protein